MSEPPILASSSPTRLALLTRAGIAVEAMPSGVDEAMLKLALRQDRASAETAAGRLAAAKAAAVAAASPGRLVIGADQILDLDGVWFDKPTDRPEAALHLQRLSGRRHRLVTAAICMRDSSILWTGLETAGLRMRVLSPEFIDSYLDQVGSAAMESVGAYQVEGLGIQLFDRIDGDFFTILGLPLLKLLDYFRKSGVIPA